MNPDDALKLVSKDDIQDAVACSGHDVADEMEPGDGSTGRDFINERLNEFIRKLVQEREHRQEEHDLRKRYIKRAFILVEAVVAVSLMVTMFVGNSWLVLSDSVVIALLTTTTANVIGILLAAFAWLFPKRSA